MIATIAIPVITESTAQFIQNNALPAKVPIVSTDWMIRDPTMMQLRRAL